MEKEWFNGFVANGLQFRFDGSITKVSQVNKYQLACL